MKEKKGQKFLLVSQMFLEWMSKGFEGNNKNGTKCLIKKKL